MVFYIGKAPSGRKTKWKMHEYKAIEQSDPSNTNPPKVYLEKIELVNMINTNTNHANKFLFFPSFLDRV